MQRLTSCRLIALDKCPGVRPIGIGELACCILGKAILAIVSGDIQEIAGALQLCAGQKAGCDVAVHAMRQIFEDTNTQDVLFVDASNAFNNLNRKTALLNINLNYPSIAKLLIGLTPSFLLMGRLSFPRKEPLREIPSPWLCTPSALRHSFNGLICVKQTSGKACEKPTDRPLCRIPSSVYLTVGFYPW